MAETSSLLNCRTGSRTGGSNPPPSAFGRSLRERSMLVDWLKAFLPRDSTIQVNLIVLAARSIHLMVRIQDSQSWHRGSIPLSTTTIWQPVDNLTCWSIHLMVRIQDSQSWHRGSIPLSTTKKRASVFHGSSLFIIPSSASTPTCKPSLSSVVIISKTTIMLSPMPKPVPGLQEKSYKMFDGSEKSCIFAECNRINQL